MIIEVQPGGDLAGLRRLLTGLGLYTQVLRAPQDEAPVQLILKKGSAYIDRDSLLALPGVHRVYASESSHPLVDGQGAVVKVGDVAVGGGEPLLMAGPCSVESREQVEEVARYVARQGATFLRGGCFKPRTSPHTFQGVGPQGLPWLRAAADSVGLQVVTEAMAPEHVEIVNDYTDLFQIGARNMQNFSLLHAVGRMGRPVLLKRAMSATVEEWLLAGEHLLAHGASGVIFCARGVRGLESQTRYTLDLSAVALLAHVYKLPVIVDPSHAAGRKDLLEPLSRAAIAAGASGLMLETHPLPSCALSDGPQQLDPQEFVALSNALGFRQRAPRLELESVEERKVGS